MINNHKKLFLRFRNKKLSNLVLCSFTLLFLCCQGNSRLTNEKFKKKSLKKLKLVEIIPNNQQNFVKLNSEIFLKFNTQVNPLTISSNTKNNKCIGTIQITSNNFRTCIRIGEINLVNNNKTIILTPKEAYAANTLHKIRLTKEIKASNGSSLNKNLVNLPEFKTSWSHQFGTVGDDSGIAISIDVNNNIYVAGITSADESGERKDLFLTKFIPNGYQRWITQPGFERTVSSVFLKINRPNKILLRAFSNGNNSSELLIANYNFDGKKIFDKTIPLYGDSNGNGLTLDNEDNIYVTTGTPFDILKLDKKGKAIWGNELAQGIIIRALTTDNDDNLYITGEMRNTLDGKISEGGTDIFLLKISQMGPKKWSRIYGSKKNESANTIAIKSDKSIAIAGYISDSENFKDLKKINKDAFVAKYGKDGRIKWEKILRGEKSEEFTTSLWTSEGDLLVGGYTESSLENGIQRGKEDSFLAKFNNDGELIWLKQFGTKENERPLALGLGSKGEIYVTGFSEGQIDGSKYNGGRDIFLVKFDKNGVKQ